MQIPEPPDDPNFTYILTCNKGELSWTAMSFHFESTDQFELGDNVSGMYKWDIDKNKYVKIKEESNGAG